MRQLTTVLTICVLAALLYTAASANSPAPPTAPITRVGDDTTQLVVDTQAHTVRIVIEGKEVGRFDASGLHVIGNIDYSGFSTDTNGSQAPAP